MTDVAPDDPPTIFAPSSNIPETFEIVICPVDIPVTVPLAPRSSFETLAIVLLKAELFVATITSEFETLETTLIQFEVSVETRT